MGTSLIVIQQPRSEYDWATDLEVLEALNALDFHIGKAARALGVQRNVLRKRIDMTPDLLIAERDYDQEIVDDAEWHLRKNASAGNGAAGAALLNAKGVDRGYGKQARELTEGIEVLIRTLGGPGKE